MKVGVRIKGDEIIVLKHNDDIIEENVETIVIITKENNAGEPAECGSVIYKEQDIEFKEVPLYTKDTFAFLMENHFISHSYLYFPLFMFFSNCLCVILPSLTSCES